MRFIVIHFLFFFVLMMRRSCEECRPTIHIFFFSPLVERATGCCWPFWLHHLSGNRPVCVVCAGGRRAGGKGGRKELKMRIEFIYLFIILTVFLFTFLSDALENWILVFLYFLVLADANFPTASMCRDGAKQIRADGHTIPALLEAILTLMPLDTYCWSPVKMSTLIIKIIFLNSMSPFGFLIGQRDGCDG